VSFRGRGIGVLYLSGESSPGKLRARKNSPKIPTTRYTAIAISHLHNLPVTLLT
jgi:hypothetical protein